MSVARLVARQSLAFAPDAAPAAEGPVLAHPHWDAGPGWKRTLNNLRLVLQPYICACLLLPWLRLYPLPHLQAGLADLCALMNTFHPLFPT